MPGATMGTAPLKDDYQQLEAQVAAKMMSAPRPPRRLGGPPIPKARVSRRVRTQIQGAMR